MADTKITALAAITTVDPAADVLPIVDISDTSMAASGTTKKVTSNQILGAGGTATLASATITGNLTVDTNTLFVDAANNRVGIGTASPTAPFDIRSNGNSAALFLRTTDPAAAVASAYIQAPVSTGFSSTVPVYGFWYQNSGMGNPAADTLNWIIASGEAMRLNSTGLGIGVSPSAKLHVEGGGAQGRFSVASASDARHEYYRNSAREGLVAWDANTFQLTATQATGELLLGSGNTTRMRMNSAGDIISNVSGTVPTLATNSQMVFNLTSNTNLRISVRGTDGTTRTANITLA